LTAVLLFLFLFREFALVAIITIKVMAFQDHDELNQRTGILLTDRSDAARVILRER
jgi:hypothetical protein